MSDNNVFDEMLEDFEDEELDDFDDELEEIVSNEMFSAKNNETRQVFGHTEDKEDEKNAEKNAVPAFETIDNKEIERQVKLRNNIWREATLTGENDDGRECALAHGLPDWDLMPPEMLVRRRDVK